MLERKLKVTTKKMHPNLHKRFVYEYEQKNRNLRIKQQYAIDVSFRSRMKLLASGGAIEDICLC